MVFVREPAVAGKFYPKDSDSLLDEIHNSYNNSYGPGRIPHNIQGSFSDFKGLIVPHAGYEYSGPVAACGYSWLAGQGKPQTVVIIGTNHTGKGGPGSIMKKGRWRTPLGEIDVDQSIATQLAESCSDLEPDQRGPFSEEHSIEVQLPFLQDLYGSDFDLVPICVKQQNKQLASSLANAMMNIVNKNMAVIISSDFSHYEPQSVAEEKDNKALEAIENLDFEQFYDLVSRHHISICGYGPIGTLIKLSTEQNLEAKRLQYATSRDISGMKGQVVGYASVGMAPQAKGAPNG